jgi:hypothetical protein
MSGENKPTRPDKGDWDAIEVLGDWLCYVYQSDWDDSRLQRQAEVTLEHAIEHLAKPDRALYPKIRGQRKTERRLNG